MDERHLGDMGTEEQGGEAAEIPADDVRANEVKTAPEANRENELSPEEIRSMREVVEHFKDFTPDQWRSLVYLTATFIKSTGRLESMARQREAEAQRLEDMYGH